jgi:2-oxoglutarate ferredoxin oxidoreductase subunit delta
MPTIEVDVMRCKGCKLCVPACPKDCIEISPEFSPTGYYPAFLARPEDCTGCTLCAVVCPDIAIEVYK